jgi:hypothetical protein
MYLSHTSLCIYLKQVYGIYFKQGEQGEQGEQEASHTRAAEWYFNFQFAPALNLFPLFPLFEV